MATDFYALAAPGAANLTPYRPGKPASEVQRELGLTDILSLASNESPLGPSPRAVEAARQALGDLAVTPIPPVLPSRRPWASVTASPPTA